MTIKQLREHRANAEKLECIERNLRLNEVHICVEGSAGPPSYEKRAKTDCGYIHGMGTISLLEEKSKLEKANRRIENYIDAIPNRRVYKALYLYCIDETLYNPTWDEVAAEMKEVSTKALKTYVERYLKNVL
nr:MAG: Protein of unknown function (DUF722) [Bacteriophage sp.]